MDMLEKSNYLKSHRIIPDGSQTWLTGADALTIDSKIRELWIAFHEKYHHADGELLQKFQKEFYFKEIPRIIGARYYRAVKITKLSPQFMEDVLAAKQLLIDTFNLELVRKELHKRHEKHRELLKQRKEEEEAIMQARLEAMFQYSLLKNN
ncbi:hypothetical protein [Ectobacillus sp. sgz5001026]|uniref:hypothetical protein n=1 Tax=Ectobacillus sp. sgz5001026 TaxID=3242473 RepID=UPI0036D25364